MTAASDREELRILGFDEDEADEVVPSQAAPSRVVSPARISTGYLNTTHPDTGLDVVFVPGEQLPEWAYAVQKAPVGDVRTIAPRKSLKAAQTAEGK
ncbi:hypothetical protein D7Z96_08710 [Pseudarthrobacter phenanthrenivorans]|uniref:Uncharacterized protein n=1 Tax=Pseudarthrobacter phenanthrenivorans TaxID=361575 RepID=A0A3B0FSA5_PSEPS|nr:hypothetical protein [Pseudarthrobacter phenanthrenivorans]RKO24501.1 hypothetical protein D7Z96_08710 [Pseudarthrobacter phenanthrenivorans]